MRFLDTLFPSTAVGPPDVTVGDLGSTSVMLSWNEQAGVIRYEVSFEYSPTARSLDRETECGSFPHEDTIDVGTATEYTLDGLEEDRRYTITVAAVYTGGSVSSEVMVTTEQAGNINRTP